MNIDKKTQIYIVSLAFAISSVIDYMTTVWFAGTKENLIRNEFSPLIVYAVEHDLLRVYVFVSVMFHYFGSFLVLMSLSEDEKLLYPARTIIIMISMVHILGGFSWYVNNYVYSSTIVYMSLIAILMTILLSGWLIISIYTRHYKKGDIHVKR